MDFDSISSNIDEVLSINPSVNILVFGDFTVHHKDWITYSGGTDAQVNSAIIFLSQMTLLRWLTFLLGSHSPALLDLFLFSDASIYLFHNGFPSIGKF